MSKLGLGQGEDGTMVYVETATKDRYRLYTYWSPEEYNSDRKEVRQVLNILSLLEAEFGVTLLLKE